MAAQRQYKITCPETWCIPKAPVCDNDYAKYTMTRLTIKSIVFLLLATAVFYWRILFTHQYSLLTEGEGVNQGYAWLQFWIVSLRQGTLPLWDPYTWAGRIFSGEMQTSAFNPLHLLLALIPFNGNGMFSPNAYHQWYAFAHFLGGCFMFALVRELGLSRFSAIVAGLCFSLGGIVQHGQWLDMFESAIWLPLVVLFLLRALRSATAKQALRNASVSGLTLGLAILAGRLHMVIMQGLVVVSAAAFAGLCPQLKSKAFRGRSWPMPALVVAVVAAVAFCAGAVQLLPSMEYSGHAIRFLGNGPALPATSQIPYAHLRDGLWPYSFLAMLIPAGFRGNPGPGEVIRAYIGVFPLIAAIIGVWKRWDNPWVRYLTGLAIAAFLYSLGDFSLLHGALYALVPRLWMAREAGRFMYLADFALPILAAFGVEALLCAPGEKSAWSGLNRILAVVAIACVAILMVPALFAGVGLGPWEGLSVLLLLLSCGMFGFLTRGHTGAMTRFVIVGLILFDLAAFNWTARNKLDVERTGTNHLARALSCRGAVDFLKSRPGLFRVRVFGDMAPNIGDLYGVQTVGGWGATLLKNYGPLHGNLDLWNVRYLLKPASAQEPGALYQDQAWKVYENPSACPRAWIVHETSMERAPERLQKRLSSGEVDPRRTALVGAPLGTALEPLAAGAGEDVTFGAYGANRLELKARAQTRGLLVLSEVFYPGWSATVNGNEAQIHEVDGALRGIVIPPGESRVVLRYAPWSVIAGGFLTVLAFLAVLSAVALPWRRQEPAT